MEMKKIFFGLMCVGLLNVSTSCSDFLEEKPKSEMSTGQNFSAPSHAYNAVNALYRKGAPEFYGNGGVYMPSTVTLGGYLSGFLIMNIKDKRLLPTIVRNCL